MNRFLPIALILLSAATQAAPSAVQRVESEDRISENIPEIPADLHDRLQRYQNTRFAIPRGWLADGEGLLVTTRFANTVQVHWVKTPGGARQQLTFYDEPVNSVAANPKRNGFVFGKDTGGAEFYQLYWFDMDTREVKLLTDGKSRNENPVWSHDGTKLAYSSTKRNGKDTDLWVMDVDRGSARPVVAEGGTWFAADFSPDGTHLAAQQFVSASETHPVDVNLETGGITHLDKGKKNSFGPFRFSRDGTGAFFTSDETGEFVELRYRDFATNKVSNLSADIAWNVDDYILSADGSRLVFLSNEDGYSVLHLLDTATRKLLPAPVLPKGVISAIQFSPDGRKLAFALNSATSPADAYAIDLASGQLTQWTQSEVGGLDTSKFIAPTLVRYRTFDKDKGTPRTIPAWYYRPRGDGPFPVVVAIHGGPEGQQLPLFAAGYEFMLDQLHIAVIAPNVRGSSGYGKSYLALDNGSKREDSVKDIGALLDWIANQPELDAARVGVSGGSYGGYMVLACMTHYNDRLRAGIDLVGISNFITFLEHTESYRRDLRRAEYGDERDPKMRAFLEKISPITNAASISKPLFVSAGANDPRVPAAEGEQIVKAVRANGADVWFLLQKDEGHGFQKKTNFDNFFATMMEFWQKNLLNDKQSPHAGE